MIPYKQSFEDHDSLAVIILDDIREKELIKKVKELSKKNNVKIDLTQKISGKKVDEVLKGTLEYLS